MVGIRKLFLIVFLSLAIAQDDPVAYLNEAISLLEKHWEKADTVDWESIRQEYLAQAEDLKTIEDTHPVIRTLLRELGDSWNYLAIPGQRYEVPRDQTGFRVMLPDWTLVYVFDESPAALAGVKVGDQIIAVNGKPITLRDAWGAPRVPTGGGAIYDSCMYEATKYCDLLREIYTPGARLQLRRVGEEKSVIFELEGQVEWNLMVPIGKRFGEVGYIELPPLKVEDQEYIGIVHQSIEDIDKELTCGWIIDVRRHAGGLGPFLDSVLPLLTPDSMLKHPRPPIAILLSPNTASMGEFTAQDIQDFAETAKTFGEETWGNHPTVESFQLGKKAVMRITTYSESITPDVEVQIDWTRFQTEDDPVIQAARSWLMEQPSCSRD
jgi:C-terminal processing protease CtpA/Prc